MRIVSGFKDYYDFPTSFYGVDEKRVYVRTREKLEDSKAKNKWDIHGKKKLIVDIKDHQPGDIISRTVGWFFTVAFCNNLYQGYYSEVSKKFIYNVDDLPELARKYIMETGYWWRRKTLKVGDYFKPEPTNINKLIEAPVMVMSPNHVDRAGGDVKNENLGLYHFGRVIEPTRAYQEVYTWIGYKEPEMPKDPKDMYRFEAKGFDKKTSFRKIK